MSKSKTDLIKDVAENSGLSKAQTKEAIDTLLSVISQDLAAGSNVVLTGFGTFQVRDRAARNGRNPQTGETMQIPAKKTVKFRPGKTLEEELR